MGNAYVHIRKEIYQNNMYLLVLDIYKPGTVLTHWRIEILLLCQPPSLKLE